MQRRGSDGAALGGWMRRRGRSEAVVVILPPCRSVGGGGDGCGAARRVAGRGLAREELRACKQCLVVPFGNTAGALVGLVFQLKVKVLIILVKTNGRRAGRLSNIVFVGADLR